MYILASCNDYVSNILYNKLNTNDEWKFITTKEMLPESLNDDVKKIFFFHWSYIVPKTIYEKYECINFHTSNLPQGKGGSPLQNQIVDKIFISNVNALRMSNDGLDAGPIYCRKQISLQGNMFDIWMIIGKVVYELILEIIERDIQPIAQHIEDNIQVYKRRKDNKIPFEKDLESIYDFIRMLDHDIYPPPFIELGNCVLKFSRAKFNGSKIIVDVSIEEIKH